MPNTIFSRLALTFTLTLALLLSVGCQSVTTVSMAGQPSDKIASTFEGMWKFNDMLFLVKAMDNGQLMFGNVDWKKNQWQVGQRIVTVTEAGDHTLLYMGTSKPPEGHDDSKPLVDQPDENYLFFKLLYNVKTPDSVIAYLPAPDVIAKAIDDGKLKGNIEKSSKGKVNKVALSSSKEALEKFLAETPTSELFLMESPLVLVRLK